MGTHDTQFDQFLAWLQAFDPSLLSNEAEVESKFVVPFFRYLGYPEESCRLQYPLKTYEPGTGKRGRKPTIDQIYFSTLTSKEQSAETSLIILEAKEPGETHLDDALEQARFYGYHLTPLFLVVTNAYRLIVVKRHGYRGEERIVDIAFHELQKPSQAKHLYRELHFEKAKRLKEQLADDLTHTQYIDLMQTLDRYPDLRAQLVKGDFQPSRTQEGRRLTVTKPKVAMVCDLPIALGDGTCRVEFSNVLLRGLTCHLTHRQIVENLLTGLETPPHWGTRRFLKQSPTGMFEAQLGQTTVILSKQEAEELCMCIDDVCHAYRTVLVSAEETLQTWDYLPVSLPGYDMQGFHILTVEPWLWKLMLRFADEFDFLKEASSWHIFDARHDHFRVVHRNPQKEYDENILIYPFYGPSDFPKTTVDILYCVEDWYLDALEREEHLSWKKLVGPHGRWTAQYTQEWFINRFIPRVLGHYPLQNGLLRYVKRRNRSPYWTDTRLKKREVPLTEVSTPAHLAPYVHQVQAWFHSYGDCQIPASLLRPYYTSLTDVVRYIDPLQLGSQYFGYIAGRVFGATGRANETMPQNSKENTSSLAEDEHDQDEEGASPTQEMKEILDGLDEHVRRMYHSDHESPEKASSLSSAWIALLEHGTISCRKELLNAARDAILPLLELSRFEQRYVLRPPWE